MFATGNNVRLKGDMTRRALPSHLDAKVERPELRRFKTNPIERVLADRGRYITAAMTVARAYLTSEMKVECEPLAGFDGWSEFVREPLIWLGEADPVKAMEAARTDDPERDAARELIEQWRDNIGDKLVKVRDIIECASEKRMAEPMAANRPDWLPVRPDFFDLLITQVPSNSRRDIDPTRLGHWLKRIRGQVHSIERPDEKIYESWRIELAQQDERHGSKWRLVKV